MVQIITSESEPPNGYKVPLGFPESGETLSIDLTRESDGTVTVTSTSSVNKFRYSLNNSSSWTVINAALPYNIPSDASDDVIVEPIGAAVTNEGEGGGPYNANLLLLGDSGGAGVGASGLGPLDRIEWPEGVNYSNVSVSGKRLSAYYSEALAGNFDSYYDVAKTCVVVIHVASNDFYENAYTDLYENTLTPLVALLKGKGFYVLCVNIFDRVDFDGTKDAALATYNAQVLANTADADTALDINNSPLNDPTDAAYFGDGIHLTAAGQEILADRYEPPLLTLLALSPRAVEVPASSPVDDLTSSTMTFGAGDGHQARTAGQATVPATVLAVNPIKPLTITARVKPTSSEGQVAAGQVQGWYLGTSGGKAILCSGAGYFSGGADVVGSINVGDGAYHTIAIELRAGGSFLYVDGTPDGANSAPASSSNAMTIGSLGGLYGFAGLIQDVEIYEGLLYSGSATRTAIYPLDGALTGTV